MAALGKAILGFLTLMVLGYLTVVLLLPPPTVAGWKPDDMTGQSAAARLSTEAQMLVGHRPSTALQ